MHGKSWLAVGFAILVLAGSAAGGPGLDAIRAEATACREALLFEPVVTPQAAALLLEAGEELTEVIALIDAGDPSQMKKVFGRLGRAMKRLEKAAKRELSADFSDFVRDREQRLWLVTSSLFRPSDVVVGGEDPLDPEVEARITKKMAKSVKLLTKGKVANAIKKLKRPWAVLVKVDPDP